MANIPYTKSEKTEKRWTVGQAVKAAELRLKGIPMCVNCLRGRYYDMSTKITLVELNQIADSLVDDSHFYRL